MSQIKVYRDNRDWWIGLYRDTENRRWYICPLPTLVIRWELAQ